MPPPKENPPAIHDGISERLLWRIEGVAQGHDDAYSAEAQKNPSEGAGATHRWGSKQSKMCYGKLYYGRLTIDLAEEHKKTPAIAGAQKNVSCDVY